MRELGDSGAIARNPRLTVGERPVVSVAGDADAAAWDAYVSSHPKAFGYHEWAWRRIFTGTFRHECIYLIARQGGRVCGVLPIVFIKSVLFGSSVTSLPFVNYGGVLADGYEVANQLVQAATAEASKRGVRHVELRHVDRVFSQLPCKQHKVTMLLPLETGMWDRIDRKARNQVRKAEKSGLTVVRGGAELVGEFYRVFARNMRDLGTPVYSASLFADVLQTFPERAKITVVRLKQEPVAAGFTIRTRDRVEIPWASSIRDFNALCPNHLLYWHTIESAVADGCTVMDFGRSTPNEGTYKFKEQWGASPVQLHWEYVLLGAAAVPDASPKNPKYRLMINTWQRLPLGLANLLGPRIVGSIP